MKNLRWNKNFWISDEVEIRKLSIDKSTATPCYDLKNVRGIMSFRAWFTDTLNYTPLTLVFLP